MTYQTKIKNRLLSLEDFDGVSVTLNQNETNIKVKHERDRSLNFEFNWSNDHFIGYFLDADNNKSQAVISLWIPLDAIHFATSYSLLIDLRAGRPSTL